ncbi:hypothetical protein niasHT_014898 [Heterodera trifolii]|uniref:Uncharacterized protein n=1 Tax=Heterodera trifolii TaxID=157864 RepID=A0ABD2LH47_9BILA
MLKIYAAENFVSIYSPRAKGSVRGGGLCHHSTTADLVVHSTLADSLRGGGLNSTRRKTSLYAAEDFTLRGGGLHSTQRRTSLYAAEVLALSRRGGGLHSTRRRTSLYAAEDFTLRLRRILSSLYDSGCSCSLYACGFSARRRTLSSLYAAEDFTLRGGGLHSTRRRTSLYAAEDFTLRGGGLHSTPAEDFTLRLRRTSLYAAEDFTLRGGGLCLHSTPAEVLALSRRGGGLFHSTPAEASLRGGGVFLHSTPAEEIPACRGIELSVHKVFIHYTTQTAFNVP